MYEQLTFSFGLVPDVFKDINVGDIADCISKHFSIPLSREDSWDVRKRYVFRKGKKTLEIYKGVFGEHTNNGVTYVHVGYEDAKNLSGSASPCKDWDEVFKEVERVLAQMGVK